MAIVEFAHVGVHAADVLRVALRHLDDFGTDFDGLAPTFLRGPAAALANGERNLIAGTPRIPRVREGLTAKEQHGFVVVERPARITTDLRHRFAKRREHLSRKLER